MQKVLKAPLSQPLGLQKSDQKALRLKELGNGYFKSKDDSKALNCYTQAVFLAEWPSADQQRLVQELNDSLDEFKRRAVLPSCKQYVSDQDSAILATCLGNRSAALYNLKRFNECLADIHLAQSLGFPAASEHKLHKRRALCLAGKQESSGARRASESDPHCSSSTTTSVASELCCVLVSPAKGHYTVAATDFEAGDIIAADTPFAAVLNTQFKYTHCSHCFNESMCLIPCCWCLGEGYCTTDCRAAAWSHYHWLECSVAERWTKVDWIMKLCLRIVLSATSNELLDVLNADSSSSCCDSRYKAIYALVSHETQFCDPTQKQALSKMAQHLVKLFGGVVLCYLQGAEQRSVSAVKSHAALRVDMERLEQLFLHHLLQLRCNSHSVPAMEGGEHHSGNIESSSQLQLGSVIFPSASLLNHSCYPNAFFRFDGSRVAVVATRVIRKGQEINNCYGPQVGRMKRADRQLALKTQYFFDCHCVACESLDGELLLREAALDALACPHCKGPVVDSSVGGARCVNCKTALPQTKLDQLRQVRKEADQLFEAATSDDNVDIEVLLKCRQLQAEVLYTHNMTLSRTHDILSKYYFMQRNYQPAAEFCRLSCSAVGVVYGSDSIELANELHKLAQILMMSENPMEALEPAHRAKALLHIYNGKEHPDCIELNELIKLLQK